jgi:hypothetical protein
MKKIVIPVNISVSFQTKAKPVPFNIISFKMIMKYLGGISADNHCKTKGMFFIGKMNPDSKIVGIINANIDTNMATC